MNYKTYMVVFLISTFGSFAFTPFARRLAFLLGAVDQPNARKIHKTPTPRLGGVAVFLGFCLPWAGLYLIGNPVSQAFQNHEKLFLALVLGACAMLGLGIYDDTRGADARKKFALQGLIAFGLWLAGYRIDELSNPFGKPIPIGWVSLPLSMLWIVGVTNAINLLDGIDGLVTGVTGCIALSLAMINALATEEINIMLSLLTLCLSGACFGFLRYNYSPASIFLGDSGSLTIGLVLACIGLLSLFGNPHQDASSPLLSVPIILFGLPIFDTFRVMAIRAIKGVSIFQADKNHVHHRLLSLGLSQKQAAWMLYSVAIFTGLAALVLSRLDYNKQSILSGVFAILGLSAYVFWKIRLRQIFRSDDDEPGNDRPGTGPQA